LLRVIAFLALASLVLLSVGAAFGYLMLPRRQTPVQTPGAAVLPEVQLSSSLRTEGLIMGSSLAVEARATAPQGISRIDFWVDGTVRFSALNENPAGDASYEAVYTWMAEGIGTHVLIARAYAADGAQADSAPLLVQVHASPATPTSTPAPCLFDMTLVDEMTLPADVGIQPGETVVKVWRVRNSGTCPWGPSHRLALVDGVAMTAAKLPVPAVIPGETADVFVELTAPEKSGHYVSRWRLQDPAGQPFGPELVVELEVVPPTPTPTPLPPTSTPAPPTPTPAPPLPLPLIHYFTVEPATITRGEVAVLRWEYSKAREAWLDGQPVSSPGELRVRPGETTTYRLVAVNDQGSTERTVTLKVQQPRSSGPIIFYLEADPPVINQGEKSVLRWDLAGAREAYLNGEGVVAPGSKVVSPLVTTSYRLEAISEAGRAERIVTVVVNQPATQLPVILYFEADRYAINLGESVTLRWDLTGAREAYLDGEGVVAPGTAVVRPATTTTYHLVAVNEVGQVEKTLTVAVAISGQKLLPVIHYFEADRTTIRAGESVTLRWDLSWAEAAYLNGQGVVAPGSMVVKPQTTTVYQLIAKNSVGKVSREVTVTVVP